MAQNREIGELGQVVTVNTAAESVSVGNTVIHTSGITVGNTSIHSNGITISGQSMNNTSYPGTANNTLYVGSVTANDVVSNTDLQANLVVIRSDIANSYSNTVSYISSSIETANAAMVANAAAAYSNSVTYTDTKIFTANAAIVANASAAYTNAVSYINSSIETANAAIAANASAAYSNAVSYTDSKIATANLAIANAYSNAVSYTDSSIGAANVTMAIFAGAAYSNAVSYTDSKIGTANLAIANAYSNSVSYADSKIATANSAMTANASAAYSNAVSYTDSKIATANLAIATAYSNATSYTDSKIDTANSAIVSNASAAYTNATSYTDSKIATANAAIVANASAAYSNATTYSSNASNISSGTVAEARLPYRMNQNVRDTDTVTFNGMTLTGNLVVSGNVNIIGANNLSLVDNMIYLNANSTVTNPDLGFAGNYNSGGYAHTGIFRDATDGIWKVYDNYGPEPDASPYIDTSNTTFHLANFQANNYFAGNTTSNWFVANNSGAYAPRFYDINNLSYYLDPDSTSVLSGLSVSSTITGSISGNAGTATSSPLLSALAAYAWSSSSIPSSYNLGIQSSFVSASEGFQSYGSVMTMKTYSAGGGAFQMYVPYGSGYGGTSLQVRFGDYSANTSAPPWTSWKTLLDSANYSSYALPLSGGTVTGQVEISTGTSRPLRLTTSSAGPWALSLYRSDTSSDINVYNAGGYWYFSSYVASGGSFRAPIFYDSNDTGYYLDPASTTYLNYLQVEAGAVNIGNGSGVRIFKNGADSINSHLYFANAGNSQAWNWQLDTSGYASLWGYPNAGAWSKTGYVTATGHWFASSSSRAPIFYDSADTTYYLDPNSTSYLYKLLVPYAIQPYNLGGANLNRITTNIGVNSGYREEVTFIDGSTVQAHVSTGSGNAGNCYQWFNTEWIDVDPEKDYEIDMWVRSDGADTIYMGWHETTGTNGTGTQISANPYWHSVKKNTNGTWVKITALLRSWRTTSAQANSNGTDRYATSNSRASSEIGCDDGVMHSNTKSIHLRYGTCYGSVSGSKTYFHLTAVREYNGHTRVNQTLSFPYFNGTNWDGSFNIRTKTSWDSVSGIELTGGSGEFRFSSVGGDCNIRADGWIYSHAHMYAPLYYDQQDTSYYVDPNSTSSLNAVYYYNLYYQGNTEYGFKGTNVYADTINSGAVGDPLELCYHRGAYTTTSGSMRAPVFYDLDDTGYYFGGSSGILSSSQAYANDWFRATGSCGLYFQDYGYGIRSAHGEGNSYATITTYGTGRNGWSGYGFGTRACIMSDLPHGGGTFGLHDNNYGWVWRWVPDSYFSVDRGYSTFNASARAPLFYDSNNTGYYCDPDSGSIFISHTVRNLYFSGVGGNSNAPADSYSLYQEPGAWTHPYPDLVIGWHTGVKIGGYYGYGGTKFYNNNPASGSLIASIGDGDNVMRSYDNIIAYASDKRLKENIVNIPNAIEKIMSLNGVTFDWKDMVKDLGFEPTNKHEAGLLAQEVDAVLPEAVEIAPFDYDWKMPGKSKSGEKYLTVKYEKLVPLLIEGIKEQQTKIDRLEQLIKELMNEKL